MYTREPSGILTKLHQIKALLQKTRGGLLAIAADLLWNWFELMIIKQSTK